MAAAPPSDDEVPRPLRLEGFHVAPGVADDEPQVVVTFAELFELPDEPWRVSVLVGDPAGERRRLSLQVDGAEPVGRAEVGDGTTWSDAGPLEVTFDPSGLVAIPLDVEAVPAGHGTAPPAVWVEAVLGDEAGDAAERRATAWFDLPSLLGEGEAGLIEGGRVAPLEPEPGDEGEPVVVDLGPGPVLGLARESAGGDAVRSTIVVTYPGPAPRALGDLALAEVVDRVEVAPDGVAGATVTPYIEINRTTGEVRLVDPRQWPVVDATGDGSWRRPEASVGDPGGAATLSFDLDAVLAALGDAPSRSTVALGLTRTQGLPDGRVVVADGVLGTTAWLDTAVSLQVPGTTAAPTEVAAPPAAADDGDDVGLSIVGIAAVVVLVLVGASLIVSGRKRRAAERDLADGAGADADADAEIRIPPSAPPPDATEPTVAPLVAPADGAREPTAAPESPAEPGPNP